MWKWKDEDCNPGSYLEAEEIFIKISHQKQFFNFSCLAFQIQLISPTRFWPQKKNEVRFLLILPAYLVKGYVPSALCQGHTYSGKKTQPCLQAVYPLASH